MPPMAQLSAQSGMFHTFQGVAPRKQPPGPRVKPVPIPGAKRVTTPHACTECKRRKISRIPKKCVYDKHRQRVVPSRKVVESLSQSLEEYRSVVKQLFPKHEIQDLLKLSRQQLLALATEQPTALTNIVPSITTDSTLSYDVSNVEPISTHAAKWDEEQGYHEPVSSEADDANSLGLHVNRPTSSLETSSVKFTLIIMLKIQPALRSSSSVYSLQDLPESVADHSHITSKNLQKIVWTWKGQTLVDAYFKRVHILIPMLDEPRFRADYLSGHRTDAPWLALLNMVFAMGSIAALKSDDYSHVHYYNTAMEYLPADSLDSIHIESIQALAIAGGYYLHYINKPSIANAVLGSAIRMASTLGLDRQNLPQQDVSPVDKEIRQRTWWSLFCLDTLASIILSRPSFGRWSPSVTIQPPEFSILQNNDSAQHAGVFPLAEDAAFCKIATQIQDLLAVSPILNPADRCNLDQQLLTWYNNLPWLLRTNDACSEPLALARCIMKWRYYNCRMFLHRPTLFNLASSNADLAAISGQDLVVIETCRNLSKDMVKCIGDEWSRNQVSGWNAVWFLYQAVMVPLISLFWQPHSSGAVEWRLQIESVLELLQAMEEWSLSARRSREIVCGMYRAALKTKTSHQHGMLSGTIPSDIQDIILRLREGFMAPLEDAEVEEIAITDLFNQCNIWSSDLLFGQQAPLDQTPLSDLNSLDSVITSNLMNIGAEGVGVGSYE
ncbi:hypothetical protein TD95_003021 [Thielaviopsis punctulata]|uniref:Xylanolytic transcriptional activator regulatory domain-containing protein n=1 Tax=Thielaviopsis punctulata TaxID=72032 RepID=A0A0F4ZCL9_9PEZI|nr:hypothetical protein TD95_003021 [Thielaviopsis punctulata]